MHVYVDSRLETAGRVVCPTAVRPATVDVLKLFTVPTSFPLGQITMSSIAPHHSTGRLPPIAYTSEGVLASDLGSTLGCRRRARGSRRPLVIPIR